MTESDKRELRRAVLGVSMGLAWGVLCVAFAALILWVGR